MSDEQLKAYHEVIDPQNREFQKMKEEGLLRGDSMKKYAYQRFIKDYLRCVDAIDENVGRILDWLDGDEELKNNTIVVYCSDQDYFTGEHGYAEKRLMYEGAINMPLLIRWPDKIKPGTRVQDMVQNIDYAPTFLDMAGVEIPTDMQGKSFKPVLEGKSVPNWREAVYYHYYDHGQHVVGRHDGIRDKRYKLIHFYTDDTWEFYDLENDPNELYNAYGDKSYEAEIKRMEEGLVNLRKQYKVPEWVFSPPYVSLKGIEQTKRERIID
jgi:arylsulfatase A-like enzyme